MHKLAKVEVDIDELDENLRFVEKLKYRCDVPATHARQT